MTQTTQRQTGLSAVKERVYSLKNTSFARGFIIISTTISRCLLKINLQMIFTLL